MSSRWLDQCRCSCHTWKGTKHVVACCKRCPTCHRNVVPSLYDTHMVAHAYDEAVVEDLIRSTKTGANNG